MFGNKKQLKTLIFRIRSLERDLNIIGEAYIPWADNNSKDKSGVSGRWMKFTQSDIQESRKSEMKIAFPSIMKEIWIPRTQILLYKRSYNKEKSQIEKMIKDQYENKYNKEGE